MIGGNTMDIGKELFIKITDEESTKEQTYKCSIIDTSKDFLYVDQPIQMETKRTLVLSRGTHIKVSFIGRDNIVYEYHSIVVHRKMLTIPAYAILPPKKSDIKRIQRRNFVRVQTAVDISIHCVKQASEPFTTVTSDISGGGLACIIPSHISLDSKQLILIYLVLPDKKSPTYIQVKARVVQIHEIRHNLSIASVEFIQISASDQQSIIRYVFETQRKQLEKYLQ